MSSNAASPGTNLYLSSQTWALRPISQMALTRNRSLNPSVVIPLSFRRSAARLFADATSSTNAKTMSSPKNASVPGSRSRSGAPRVSRASQRTNSTSLAKATFQWVKGELIGKGSYARVYLALNATTGEIMAVKQVELPQTASDRSNSRQLEIMQALKFESNTLKDLDHANIVQYLGYEESPRFLSIFLEYVPGGTISSCLRDHGRFREEVTKSFTSQILEGLQYLHSKGILHRDLKADNILVEQTGICKISDFGISKKAEDINHGRAFTGMKGTVFWMAPEILDHKGGYDVKVDIWSMGCIVLEMWTGARPWSGEELAPVMMKLFKHKLPPPLPADIDLSETALDFRRQCFRTDPRDRPSAVELQRHPYLVLPPAWRFELSDIQVLTPRYRSSSLVSRKSRKSYKSNIFDKPSYTLIPPIPQRSARDIRLDESTVKPTGTLYHSAVDHTQQNPSRDRPDPVTNMGPPLVFITPPSSPVQDISLNQIPGDNPSIILDTSEGCGTSVSTWRGFYVVNPDPEPDLDVPVYIYDPPPLPSINTKSPYSARLVPPLHHVADITEHYPIPPAAGISPGVNLAPPHLSSTSINDNNQVPTGDASINDNDSQQTSPHESNQTLPELTSTGGEYDYESDSDVDVGTSLWKKPPVDFAASAQGRKSDSDLSANLRVSRRSRSRKTKSIYRHKHDYVYEHLQEFFPHHDLDKAVIEVGPGGNPAPTERGKKGETWVKKSIRMVAEEQVSRVQSDPVCMRRRTKLWDSNLEELRM